MKSNSGCFIFIAITMLAIASLCCCKSTKLAPAIVIENIRFGSGGGFTGRVTTYSLTPDGQLSLIENEKNTAIKKIDSIATENLFEKAKVLRDYQYNVPGNMNSYLEIKGKEKLQRIVWEMSSPEVDPRVTQLYDELSRLANK